MENKIQKIYNADTRELYGEFDIFEFTELRIKYVKNEIQEKLCYIDENDRMYEWDEFAIPDEFRYKTIDDQYGDLLHTLVHEQMRKRLNKRKLHNPNYPL